MTVEFDVNPLIKRLDGIKAVQVPFAASLALNRIAKGARKAQQDEMRNKFDRPVPYTINSIYIKSSTKSNLNAELGIKEFAGKGNAARDYLFPQIAGGNAYVTRFQKSLRAKGILAPNEYAVPTQSDYLRRNQFGNVTPGEYTKVLFDLQAFRDSSAFAYRKNSKLKRAKPQRFFARTTAEYNKNGGNLYPGIYFTNKVAGARKNNESAAFWIQRTPRFNGKYNFTGIGSQYAINNWNKEFGQALAEAIASGK